MILGIDLGTTYSVCSYIDENGEPQIITNMEGQRTTPSVVYFETESSMIVGQTAKENSICCPEDGKRKSRHKDQQLRKQCCS